MAPTHLTIACLLLATGVWSEDTPKKEKFTSALMKELASSDKNVVFSPVSMESALGVVGFGARGKTMEEMFTSLGLDPQNAKQTLSAKQQKLNEKPAPGAEWETANRIMVSPDLPVKQEYITEVTQAFPGVSVGNYDFSSPAHVAAEVNSWVAGKTKNVITKLLEDSSVDPQTKMIVLNAVYFKGEWKHGFDKKRTNKECFYSEPGKCKMTDMMHIKEDFKYGYYKELNSQIIELPYKNEKYSMVIVLPDERTGNLQNLIKNLDADDVLSFIDKRQWTTEVQVTLPKFETEFTKEMKEPLMNLGMKSVFTDASDLSGMISGLRARVGSVIHKAKITVDEDGTVAAAATGIQIVPVSLPLPPPLPIYFTADRPFSYMIRHKDLGLLFIGNLQ